MFKRMIYSIGSVSVVFSLVMILASLSTILLGRALSPEEFGEFSLIRTLILVIPPLAVWGQDVSVARFFSRNQPGEYNWHTAFYRIMFIGALLSAIGITVAWLIYKLDWQKCLVLYIAGVAYVSTLFSSNLWRGKQSYIPAILMLNGFRGAFFLFVSWMVLTRTTSAQLAIYGYLAIIILFAVVNIILTFKYVPHGRKSVPRELYTNGILLLGSQSSVTIMGSLDSLFIPRFLDLASLALYQAASVPSQLFNILGRAGKYVWIPEFGKSRQIQVRRISVWVGVAAISLLGVMMISARPVLHILYAGKYDDGTRVLQILLAAGAVRLFYNLSSSIIIGKLNQNALTYHLVINILMMLVEMIVLYIGLKFLGVVGAASAMLIVALLRAIISYGIIWKFREQLR